MFDGRPVALVGPNGAGKTNILEAVSLLSPGRGLRRAAAEDLGRRPEAVGWKISARVAGIAADHDIETGAEPGEPRSLRIDGKPAPQTSLGRILRILWLVPAMDRLWIEAAEGRRRFLDRLTLSFAPDHAEAVLTYEKAMRDRNRLLKDMVTDPHWYVALESQMADSGAQITTNRLLALDRLQQQQLAEETGQRRQACQCRIAHRTEHWRKIGLAFGNLPLAGIGGGIGRFLDHPVVQHVGRLSFGLYLFHSTAPLLLGWMTPQLWSPFFQGPWLSLRLLSFALTSWGLAWICCRYLEGGKRA